MPAKTRLVSDANVLSTEFTYVVEGGTPAEREAELGRLERFLISQDFGAELRRVGEGRLEYKKSSHPLGYHGEMMQSRTDATNWRLHLQDPARCPPPGIAHNPYRF